MSDPTQIRLLRHTPLTDLLRGRLTGRLDWQGRIAAAGLPPALAERVTEVARRTRLWRTEKTAVAAELIAHFQDGLDAGVSPEQLADDFGDPRTAARLIRRAKRRQRPLAWHAARVAMWGIGGIVALYAVSLGQYILGRPSPSVDYVARLNAPAIAIPEAERAYPLYQEIAKRLRPWPMTEWKAHEHDSAVQNALPDDPLWPETVAWLHQHADTLAMARRAAAMPKLGLVFSLFDQDLRFSQTPMMRLRNVDLSPLTNARDLTQRDARLAVRECDGPRFLDDLKALQGIARLARTPSGFARWNGVEDTVHALAAIDDALQANPAALSDAQWAAVVHSILDLGENPALDTAFSDAAFADMLQNVYTDDGHGDGRPTLSGVLKARPRVSPSDPGYAGSWLARVSAEGLPIVFEGARTWFGSRAAVRAEYERLRTAGLEQLRKPLREADWSAYEQWLDPRTSSWEIADNALRPLPVRPSDQRNWEAVLAYRDGLTVAVALELYHRGNRQYPTALSELTPDLLPRVPLDRADGQPLRYHASAGRFVLYSIGSDRRDDGGRPPIRVGETAVDDVTAPWPPVRYAPRTTGDFILFPRPHDPPLETDGNPPSQ